MRSNFIYILTIVINLNIWAQTNKHQLHKEFPIQFSKKESHRLSQIPQLKLPETYKNKNLPAVLDNSSLMYFRPLFEQIQAECGQASGIGMNFTFEIDFLRNLPADIEENQYPPHYSWNFENGGEGWFGVSYLHSFEILRMNDTPNVVDYGGLTAGGHERWMSGYNEYYNGMKNRINDYYAIKVGTPEGLLTLKHWMNDHLNGSEYGGVASIYSDSGWDTHLLSDNTPEGGKHVIIAWGNIVGHALTICGYNDSIRYDYNGDGIYTNDMDINEDDVIDMKDWEIGGLKYANNFWEGNCYADSGFCYVMYKTLADEFGNGGLWNNEVHVVRPKQEYSPLLTARVVVKHDSRNKIKLLFGISSDTNDIEPNSVLDFPIFDFQGGNQYMQGGDTVEENKTIEIGFDISLLLNEINPGQFAKVFFQLLEKDPDGIGTGEIVHFSAIDYSNGINEIYCNESNVPIVENGITTLSLTHLFNLYSIAIDTEELPPATLHQPYEQQLTASGGNAPYRWKLLMRYTESVYDDDYFEFEDEQLQTNNPEDGFAFKQLDFNFPIYGNEYSEVFVSTDGFLFFDQNLYPWPYLYDEFIYLKNLKMVAPFICEDIEINTLFNDGIWYQGDENSASFRWKASLTGLGSDYEINVGIRLFPSGTIEFMYGNIILPEDMNWRSGISNGDLINNQVSSVSNQQNPPENHVVKFMPPQFIPEIEITDEGILHGIPDHVYNQAEISVKVFDNNNISAEKCFMFNTEGVLMEYAINANGNEIIEASEKVKLDFLIQNTNNLMLTNAFIKLNSYDPYIMIIDSSEYIGSLNSGESLTIENIFEFDVAHNIPDNYPIPLTASIITNQGAWQRDITLHGFSARLKVDDHYI